MRDLLTFSIGFESHGGIEGDEFRWSDVVAERFATDHHRIRISSDRLLPALGGAIAAMSEPMVSHDVVAFYLLSQEVAKHVHLLGVEAAGLLRGSCALLADQRIFVLGLPADAAALGDDVRRLDHRHVEQRPCARRSSRCDRTSC